MYARTTTLRADPATIDAGIAHVQSQVLPAVKDIEGYVGMSMLVDRESGRCISTTAWQSEEALQNSAEMVKPLRDTAVDNFGAGASEVESWEIAVVHRDHAAPEGACARITWLSGDADLADRAADIYRMAVLPRVQELAGFCSSSFMINRATGRAVGTVVFETREHMEASRDAAMGIRTAASGEVGATIDDVAEMDVAFAHLHVPEMA